MPDAVLSDLHDLPLVFTATLDSDSVFIILKCIPLGKSFNLSDLQFSHQYRIVTSTLLLWSECWCSPQIDRLKF